MKTIKILIILLALMSFAMAPARPAGQQIDVTPPVSPVKLIFIHHSTGGNWLASPSGNELGGDLGRALMENNYFVSATNYGWGPDGVGDRTDIPNWIEWFRGERSPDYMQAVYSETGQNFGDFGAWPRQSGDPGGENRIILFKSCFPNSELEGKPDDPPNPEGWLTVANAKYTYNEILKYFASRPDKLFVVITAPPLSSSPNSANARAFNLWLVNDWLRENNYSLNNVGVFDFYNVLTGPNNHHRVVNGQVEHVFTPGKNLLNYPSGDDHPSRAGNQKATAEFVPMLNAFYNRWKAGAPDQPPSIEQPLPTVAPTESASQGNESNVAPTNEAPANGEFVQDFENGSPGWEAFFDEGSASRVACAASKEQAHSGAQSLKIDFNVAKEGWGTCALMFNGPRNFSSKGGLSLSFQSAAPGATVHVDVYAGPSDNRETYYYVLQMSGESKEWMSFDIPWSDFHRVEWEADGGSVFAKPDQVTGFAFGFPTDGSRTNQGVVYLDDLRLFNNP